MVVSLKPERLKRYKDVAKLLVKYGRSDLISAAGLEDSVLPDEIAEEAGAAAPAEELAKDLESLGPTFIKLGQLLRRGPISCPVHTSTHLRATTRSNRAVPV